MAQRANETLVFRLREAVAVAFHLFKLAAIRHDDVAPIRPDDLRGSGCLAVKSPASEEIVRAAEGGSGA
ncbi:hypothetical protein [Microvirga aerophila]|uniref:hypothetical protein n=1 Tax=Microvirga aerophila TaxID=670291 RepID=UPI0011BE84A5|nr:hypothetical protein [Microvirga aerophila]